MRLPIRLRLTIAFAAGMALVLAGLGAFLYLRMAHDLLHGVDMELRSRAQVILGVIRQRDPQVVHSSQGELIDPDEAFAQVLTPRAGIIDSSPGVAGAPMLTRTALSGVAGPTFVTKRVRGLDDPGRLLVVPRGRSYVVVGATLGDRNDALSRLRLELAIGGPAALALVSMAGWALAGAALRPVERMRREAAAVSLAEPSRRLPVPDTGDELARLGTTLNSMLDRLHESLQREQRFLDEASHELRTPLGVLKMELDLALARARTPAELEEALRSASVETDRLVRLAEDLLVLSRARDGTLPVDRRDSSVGEILHAAAASSAARAERGDVVIDVECQIGMTARIDPQRIRQAIDDLLDNALRSAPAGGTVTLAAVQDDGVLRLSVRDTGPGFPDDVLRRAGEAFGRGRGESSAAGAGLGLAIVSAIAGAHGGRLRLQNLEGGGASATVEVRV